VDLVKRNDGSTLQGDSFLLPGSNTLGHWPNRELRLKYAPPVFDPNASAELCHEEADRGRCDRSRCAVGTGRQRPLAVTPGPNFTEQPAAVPLSLG
jgi:hypothetical protein